MFVYAVLCLTLLLAAGSLRLLWRSLARRRVAQPARFAAAVAAIGFVALYGGWVYASVYLRAAYLVAAAGAGIAAFLLKRHAPPARPRTMLYGTAAALLLTLNVLFYTGTAGRARYVNLRFPLKAGRYFVLQGGKGLPANMFHYNSRRAVYAMDIVQLDGLGRRSRRVFSRRLGDYYIFGDTVFAPCAGRIGRAVSDNPDNIPPHRDRGPHNLNGVVIDGEACTVFLGHLQQGKVFVQAGDSVIAGQPLGLAGNSGMSIEPHLHMQAHVKSTDGAPWYRQPQLFMRFFGKEYLLFQEIDATRSTP